jgi:hypothetical protein
MLHAENNGSTNLVRGSRARLEYTKTTNDQQHCRKRVDIVTLCKATTLRNYGTNMRA